MVAVFSNKNYKIERVKGQFIASNVKLLIIMFEAV